MKTTIDLPDGLMKRIKLRAVRDGRKLKDAVADLLRKGLAVVDADEPAHQNPKVVIDPARGWPVIVGGRPASPDTEMTPDRIFEIMQAQEVQWHEDACR